MAFNSQGQWQKKQWVAFKLWVEKQSTQIDKRLHLLRFKSAITRRRLTQYLLTQPPTFDDNAKKASFVYGDDNIKVFPDVWEPTEIKGAGPVSAAATAKPKKLTGVETLGIKDFFTRELRSLEYFEHLIQKTRFEIERIEDEVYWLECAKEKILAHEKTIDAQFENQEFSDNLLDDTSTVRVSFFEEVSEEIGRSLLKGHILAKASEDANDSQFQMPVYAPINYSPLDVVGDLKGVSKGIIG